MSSALTANTGDGGLHAVGVLAYFQLGWAFRPQPERDVGIDAQLETILEGKESGRMLGLQIKAGASWFSRPTPDGDGWVFSEDTQTHRDYWLRYRLPVLLVLYNPETNTAYWQHITAETAIITGKGFKIVVPAAQRFDATAKTVLAALARKAPPDGLSELLDGLPGACAGRLRVLDDHDPVLARRLAAELVAGRGDPKATIERIMRGADPAWRWLTWAALGEFANEYDLTECAAECFLRAEQAGAEGEPGRWQAFTGLVLADSDPDRARQMLTESYRLPGGRLLSATGLAWLDHGGRTGPVRIPPEISESEELAAADPTIQRFLADQLLRAGNLAAAIAHHERALQLAPDSAGQQLALAEALLRREGNGVSGLRMSDYRRAANLASAARAAQRRWRGNSLRAAELLMQALTMAGDDEAAMRIATAAPEGDATQEEAACPALAFPAARTAYERGQVDRGDRFAAVVEASQDPVWTSQLEAIRADHQGMDVREREKRWRTVVAAGVTDGQRLWALSQLAALGCWPLAELDAMKAGNLLAPGMYDLLHARALSVGSNHQGALALLRANLNMTSLVAEEYARLLNTLGRVDDCVAACDQASNRFGETRLDLYALDVLTQAGRIDEVLARGNAFLSRTELPFYLRHYVRAKLIDVYAERMDWFSCERLAAGGLNESLRLDDDLQAGRVDPLTLPATAHAQLQEHRRQYAWMLIINQFNQGDVDRASSTMQAHHPEVRTAAEAAAWVDLNRIRGWTPASAQEALAIAQWPETPPVLAGRILFSLIQTIPSPTSEEGISGDPDSAAPVSGPGTSTPMQMPAEFHEQLSAAWRAHMDAQEPQAFEALPGDDSQLLSRLRSMLEPVTARQALAHEAIWRGQAPLAAASAAAGTPYLLSLAQRRSRILPAVAATDDIYQLELQAAVDALGKRISVETIALYLSTAVLDRWRVISVEFSNLLLAEPTERDILNSHIAARAMANVAGHLGLDPHTGQLHAVDMTNEDRTAILERTSAVHTAAQDCQIASISDLSSIDSRHSIEHFGAWLAPVAIAIEQAIPLYSDDVVLRALARARGVPCFGTLALLDVLINQRNLTEKPEEVLRALFNHNVVDLGAAAELILTSPDDGHPVSEAILVNLARPAMWQRHRDNLGEILAAITGQIYHRDPATLADVTRAIASGCAAAFADAEACLALVAAIVLTYATGVTAEATAVVVPAVRAVAASYGVDPTARLREFLHGILTDPDGTFQLAPEAADQVIDDAMRDL